MNSGLSGIELAEHILRTFFATDFDESVSRINTINALAGTGRAKQPYRRTCADGRSSSGLGSSAVNPHHLAKATGGS